MSGPFLLNLFINSTLSGRKYNLQSSIFLFVGSCIVVNQWTGGACPLKSQLIGANTTFYKFLIKASGTYGRQGDVFSLHKRSGDVVIFCPINMTGKSDFYVRVCFNQFDQVIHLVVS